MNKDLLQESEFLELDYAAFERPPKAMYLETRVCAIEEARFVLSNPSTERVCKSLFSAAAGWTC